MQGPGPSEAGPSNSGSGTQRTSQQPPAGIMGSFQVACTSTQQPASAPYQAQPAYYDHTTQTWGQTPQWQAYAPQPPPQYYPQYHTQPQHTAQPHVASAQPLPDVAPQPKARTPTPPPPPPYHRNWDAIVKRFLLSAGLTQALRGFESDILVMSSEWEKERVSTALFALCDDLNTLRNSADEDTPFDVPETALEERKLDHAHFRKDIEPRTPSTITKDISRFLAQNRARNDASNRKEFLLSIAEKKRRLQELHSGADETNLGPSCARTDAKTQNRDVQMKYDIVKNEDGPLRKTLKREQEVPTEPSGTPVAPADAVPTAERYPALDERLRNIEAHLAVRYVPSPPRSLLDRIKFLEEHLVHLEKDYPPWAALHFNQPHRGWPPPPRLTPIIVPSHLTAATEPSSAQSDKQQPSTSESAEAGSAKPKGKSAGRGAMSSLQRAVLERLEVQKARNDLEGVVKREPET